MPGISEPAVSGAELPDWRGTGPRSSIHRHVGQRPIMAAGNTDGDLAMLQWTASPYRVTALRGAAR
jgi:hypothetical protein